MGNVYTALQERALRVGTGERWKVQESPEGPPRAWPGAGQHKSPFTFPSLSVLLANKQVSKGTAAHVTAGAMTSTSAGG